jgi:hypothetical protein
LWWVWNRLKLIIITDSRFKYISILACICDCWFDHITRLITLSVIKFYCNCKTMWRVNQKLTPISEKEETHCFDQRTVNCSTSNFQETVTVQEKKERKVTDNQRRCRMVQKKSQGTFIRQSFKTEEWFFLYWYLAYTILFLHEMGKIGCEILARTKYEFSTYSLYALISMITK